jgi:hypothetical protein
MVKDPLKWDWACIQEMVFLRQQSEELAYVINLKFKGRIPDIRQG